MDALRLFPLPSKGFFAVMPFSPLNVLGRAELLSVWPTATSRSCALNTVAMHYKRVPAKGYADDCTIPVRFIAIILERFYRIIKIFIGNSKL